MMKNAHSPCIVSFHNTQGSYYSMTVPFSSLPPTDDNAAWQRLIKLLLPEEYAIAEANEFQGEGLAGTNLILKDISSNNSPSSEEHLIQSHQQSFKNFLPISYMKQVGCFSCLSIVDTEKITDWIIEGDGYSDRTAICPMCHSDSIILSTNISFLRLMKQYWLE